MGKKNTAEDKESYSEHLGMRLKPQMYKRLRKWANLHHLSPAPFARAILLSRLEELEKMEKSADSKKS